MVEFPDGNQAVHEYDALVSAIYCQVDEEGNEWYTYKAIIDHKKKPRGGRGRTKGWFLLVEWVNGETTWQTLTSMKESNPYDVAKYAQENDLIHEPAFAFWAKHVLKKQERYVRAAKSRRLNNRYKYGVDVPRNVTHALEIDAKNENHCWRDAIASEMKSLNDMKVFNILERGARPPEGHQRIPMLIIFDIKMDFRTKARLVAGGHVTDVPPWDCFSSVASRESVRLIFLLADLNGLELVMIDVGNAYPNATCKEKVYAICGPEFGELEGCIAVIVQALYGLRGSGSAWHAHFADSLRALGFTPSKADPDMWLRRQTRKDNTEYYEYIVVYVDDALIVSHNPQAIIKGLEDRPYTLKGGGPPEVYLGATIGRYTFKDKTSTWYMSSTQYLKSAIGTVEEKLGYKLITGRIYTPLETHYHPEIDGTPLLGDDEVNYYMSLIGILQWLNELGRIDICFAVQLMSRFNAMPREGHMKAVLRIFAYLKSHPESKLVFDSMPRDFSNIPFAEHDWSEMYPNATEELPDTFPEPLGQPIQISTFVDAAHADDLVTRRSTTGIINFVNGTPIRWYSKRQNAVESSTYGSEFVALRIATELIIGLRFNLRMLGVPLLGPANVFCDNQSVVTNSTIPSSMLKKKHNAISYHKVRESIAASILRIAKEHTSTNLADILTKPLAGPQFKMLISHILR